MFVVVAVNAKILPVAAVWGVVVMIMILVVHREFMEILCTELAAAASANPGVNLKRPRPVVALPCVPMLDRVCDDLVDFRFVGHQPWFMSSAPDLHLYICRVSAAGIVHVLGAC